MTPISTRNHGTALHLEWKMELMFPSTLFEAALDCDHIVEAVASMPVAISMIGSEDAGTSVGYPQTSSSPM